MTDPRVLVVADDLTGAMDAAGRFAERGLETEVGLSGPTDAPVSVVDTDSRYAAPEEARRRVADAVAGVDSAVVYKKIDSTLRGNVAAEVDAAMTAADAPVAVVAPAFPQQGRVTVRGHHLVDGRPVTETEAGSDPDKPVTSSHLPSLFEGSTPVAHLSLDDVRDEETARKRLRRAVEAGDGEGNGRRIVTCDATLDAHLRHIAAAARALPTRPVYVGSAGLAGHVSTDRRPVVGIAGSVNDRTLEQLSALPDGWVVRADPERVVSNPTTAARDAADAADDRLHRADAVVVTAATSTADVEATLANGDDAGLSPSETRSRVARALGEAAAAIASRRALGGLFVTGGTTARRVFGELGATGVEVTPRAVETGTPVGRLRGGGLDGTPVVTKAGGFGDAEHMFNCLAHLGRHNV